MDALALFDELRILAQTGLYYADDPYDEERYERILELAEDGYAETLDLPPEEVRETLAAEFGHVTPKVGAGAAITDGDDRVLLVKRTDDGTWCLPCGWVEPDDSPAEAAVRETREETGLDVEVTGLQDVYHRPAGVEGGPHAMVAVVYRCEVVGGEPETSRETEAVRYWRPKDVPEWHEGHRERATDAVEASR